jgi:hypothetical protein
MIFLLAAFIGFFFLVVGSITFLVCISIPPLRKYALSSALWFAVSGLCSVMLLFFAVFGLIAGGLVMQKTGIAWQDAPRLFTALGKSFFIVSGVATCAVSTIVAWFHQALIHRFTFVLFRLYAMFVSAGIGSILGALFIWIAMGWDLFPHAVWAAAGMLPVFSFACGALAYRHFRALRGDAPTRFTWITPDEFAGF